MCLFLGGENQERRNPQSAVRSRAEFAARGGNSTLADFQFEMGDTPARGNVTAKSVASPRG